MKLHAVPDARPDEPADMSYEYRERQHVMSRDWAAVHIAADRRPALPFWSQAKRGWR